MQGGGVVQRGTPAQITQPVSTDTPPRIGPDGPMTGAGGDGPAGFGGPKMIGGAMPPAMLPPTAYEQLYGEKYSPTMSPMKPAWAQNLPMPGKVEKDRAMAGKKAVQADAVRQRGTAQPVISAATPLPATVDRWRRGR
jgi:hypothetical protein